MNAASNTCSWSRVCSIDLAEAEAGHYNPKVQNPAFAAMLELLLLAC